MSSQRTPVSGSLVIQSPGCVMVCGHVCEVLCVGVGGEFLSHHHPLRTFKHSDLVNGPVLCIIINA